MRVEVATRPAAVSRFRRGKLGGPRTDRGGVPEHVVVILRLNNMVFIAAVERRASREVCGRWVPVNFQMVCGRGLPVTFKCSKKIQ